MSDASDDAVGEGVSEDDPEEDATEAGASGSEAQTPSDGAGETGDTDEELEALRQEVEEKYDFENFGPQDMAEMSAEEWEAAFDPDTWITGEELLDRVEADVKSRVADRDVFARVERFDDLLVAYSDEGYAAVYPDGTIEGRGTVLRDVKPTVALCSMDSYEVPDAPEEDLLPKPQEVPESSDALGNTVLQVVAGAMVLAGLAVLAAWLLYTVGVLPHPQTSTRGLNLWLLIVVGVGFLVAGVVLFAIVANARLSDKYRAEEYRNRLRAVGLEDGERPEFLDDISGLEGELPEELASDDRSESRSGGDGETTVPADADGGETDGDARPGSEPRGGETDEQTASSAGDEAGETGGSSDTSQSP